MEKSILIVDDDVQIQNLLRSLLVERNYHVTVAKDGWAGLHGALNVHPDLILLDIKMPALDGIAVLAAINDMTKLTPNTSGPKIIMMSVLGDRETVLKVKGMKAFDFIVKPFDLKDLLSRIDKALNKKVSL